MGFIISMCSYLLGNFLWAMGYGPSTWQFWAVLITYLAPNGLWFYKDHKRSIENK